MSGTYQYVKIRRNSGTYFCLQQSLTKLAFTWYVKRRNDALGPNGRPGSPKKSIWLVMKWLLNQYRFSWATFKMLINLASYKYQLRSVDSVIELPFYGQTCLPVHKGYKIFDFRRGVAVKIFDNHISASSIINEIEQLKKVSQLDFAPSIRRWKIDEKWYEEDYIFGCSDDPKMPPDSGTLLKQFRHDLVQHINSLVLFQKAINKDAMEYCNNMIKTLESSRFSHQKMTVNEFTKIKNFLDSMAKRLSVEGNSRVFLVFTHGDFCPSNIQNTRYGKKLIDWEGAAYRSALFDFYSYFFFRSLIHNLPINKVVSEIHDALPFFISRLAKKAPEVSNSLLYLEPTYRWLYYIERISMLVERRITDKHADLMGRILGYIEVFNGCEEVLAVDSEVNR